MVSSRSIFWALFFSATLFLGEAVQFPAGVSSWSVTSQARTASCRSDGSNDKTITIWGVDFNLMDAGGDHTVKTLEYLEGNSDHWPSPISSEVDGNEGRKLWKSRAWIDDPIFKNQTKRL